MLVGTRKFGSNDIVQSYTQTFHVPYVSASLSDVQAHTGPGYQLHMKPSHTQALVDIIIHFGWRNFHYVYDSEEGKTTVKILKFGTPQTIAIIVLKIEKFDVTLH